MKRTPRSELLNRTIARLTALLLLAAFLCASLPFFGQTHAQNTRKASRDGARAKAKYPALSRYAIDLTKLARQGRLDAEAGHDAEVSRAAQLLAQDSLRNPVLLTDSSVNASSLAQSLALKIATGDAPASLLHKRLFSLNLDALSANAKTPEVFAARLQAALSEVLESKGEVILFVNSLEQFVGARANAAVSDALRDALANNKLRVLGAASPQAFAEINADASLSPLFQQSFE